MIRRRFAAFCYALEGGMTLIRSQVHARFHAVASIVVVVTGLMVSVSTLEWCILALSIAIVWIAEALNTGIELIADEVTLERRDRIKSAKDIAAFGVLLAAVCSAICGGLVFLPHLRFVWMSLVNGSSN
jgi:diacylglycerol kinase (ATP)